MVACPNCQAENRSGAKFCKNCSLPLPESSSATRPLDLPDQQPESQEENPDPGASSVTRRLVQNSRTGTKPLRFDDEFLQRPAGAIFGDRYLFRESLSGGEDEHTYRVKVIPSGEDLPPRVCPNSACGAIFPPRNEAPEKYCTDCGAVLETYLEDLWLIERRSAFSESLIRTVSKGLSHGGVRAPLAAFSENLVGRPRFCMVFPMVKPFQLDLSFTVSNPQQVFSWGRNLARGLNYLHDNGVYFDGKFDSTFFGISNGQAVWSDFSRGHHHREGYVTERDADTRTLAQLIFNWQTGKEVFSPDSEPQTRFEQLFQRIFTSTDPLNGEMLADWFEEMLVEGDMPKNIDLYSGRLSHVGVVRKLNEDSLLTLELDRMQQSVSRAIGVYLVADGMGGHAGGEVASGNIVDLFARHAFSNLMLPLLDEETADPSNWLIETVKTVNREVFNLRKSAGTDMGSTLVAAVMIGNRVWITHVGDSRAYLVNENEILRLTVDHSLVERLVESHQISREEARHHPQRNVIYRTIGDKPEIQIDTVQRTLKADEYLLLCSDGLSGMVEDPEMHRIILSANSPQTACNELVKAANAAGGQDNISVILVKVVAP